MIPNPHGMPSQIIDKSSSSNRARVCENPFEFERVLLNLYYYYYIMCYQRLGDTGLSEMALWSVLLLLRKTMSVQLIAIEWMSMLERQGHNGKKISRSRYIYIFTHGKFTSQTRTITLFTFVDERLIVGAASKRHEFPSS